MKHIVAIMTILLGISSIASANDLATHKAAYEKQMEDLILEHGGLMTKLGQQYVRALNTLLEGVKKTGDLDKTTAVMDEISRFNAEKIMPEQLSELPKVQQLQSVFVKQRSIYDADKGKKIISLSSKYDRLLEALQRSLVSSDKLDDARAIQQERNRAKSSEEYLSASEAAQRYAARKKSTAPKSAISGSTARPLQPPARLTKANFRSNLSRYAGRSGKVIYRFDPQIPHAVRNFPTDRSNFSDRPASYTIHPMEFEPNRGTSLTPPIFKESRLHVDVNGVAVVHLTWTFSAPEGQVDKMRDALVEAGWLLLKQAPYNTQYDYGLLEMLRICVNEDFEIPTAGRRPPTLVFSSPKGAPPQVAEE